MATNSTITPELLDQLLAKETLINAVAGRAIAVNMGV
jgi:hypothetical protein